MGNFSKINGTWEPISKYFKKTNGQWENVLSAWSKFSPTGKDNNYYKTRDTITIDVVYTTDKKLSMHINNVEHFSNFAVDDTTFQNVTIKAGVGMTNFTIKEFKVERTNG